MADSYIKRKIDGDLLSWTRESNRKPLLLRGARQVGKSSAIRHLARRFEYFLEVNFELDKQAKDLFAKNDLSPKKLCQELAAIYDTPVTHSSANGLPLGAGLDVKKQKMLLLDTGVFQRLLGLPLADLLISEDFSLINKGNIAELFVGLELLKSGSCYEQKNLYYWHRESKNSNAEVDFVVQFGQNIVPIEVKSNTKGAMQSMRLFLEEKRSSFGIRASLENFGELPGVRVVPVYGVGILAFPSIGGEWIKIL